MIRRVALFCMCLFSPACAEYRISAQDVNFDGSKARFDGEVCLTTQAWTVAGGHAEYVIDRGDSKIIILPSEDSSGCVIETQSGIYVTVSKAIYFPNSREVVLEDPKGVITSVTGVTSPIAFRAKRLYGDEESQQMTLIDDVAIHVPEEMSLESSDRVTLFFRAVEGTRVIDRAVCSGNQTICGYDSHGEQEYILANEGTLWVDLQTKTLRISSDARAEISYRNRLGHVFGKDLTVDLSGEDGYLPPRKLTLCGDVQLLSGGIIVNGELQGATQFVSADSLELDPDRKSLVMRSYRGNRVLFFDKMNNVQMSAPKLVMKQDEVLGRPTVKGFGDIRFRFMQQEFEQIKKRFYFGNGGEE